MKKTIYGLLLFAVILLILFLTFQDAAGTVKLSEGFRLWLEQFGYHTDPQSIRSNAHLVLYFVFGLALTLYGRAYGWKCWQILLIGCLVGLLDESIKLFLPTREFDMVDLIKDYAGMLLAFCTVTCLGKFIKLMKRENRYF